MQNLRQGHVHESEGSEEASRRMRGTTTGSSSQETKSNREVKLGRRCSCEHETALAAAFQQENIRAEGSGPDCTITDDHIDAFFGPLDRCATLIQESHSLNTYRCA